MVVQKGEPFFGYSETIEAAVPLVAIGSATEVAVFAAPFRLRLVKLSIVPNTAISGANNNYFTLGFYNKGSSGAVSNTIASKAFTLAVDAGQFDETDLGNISAQWRDLKEGDVVSFFKAETGAGLEMPELIAQVRYIKL